MFNKLLIAINRETQTRFGLEPYNLSLRAKRKKATPTLASGEFGDTASTVAAGKALEQSRPKQQTVIVRDRWVQE